MTYIVTDLDGNRLGPFHSLDEAINAGSAAEYRGDLGSAWTIRNPEKRS